jgi:NTP pyrophosphatase (non-canonical NTP hydrolase)
MEQKTFDELIENVRLWATDKQILVSDYSNFQMLKVVEEIGETAAAMARKNKEGIKDGIGDSFVTLIILAMQLNLTPQECLEAAWEEIKNRTGKTENGVFIKSSDQ